MLPVACPKQLPGVVRSLLLVLFVGVLLVAAQPVLLAQDDAHVYLPVIKVAPPMIYGTVTYEGTPIAGITVDLIRWQPESDNSVVVAQSVTGADGGYQFLDAPTLAQGQEYWAEFNNFRDVPIDGRFVWSCHTTSLNQYADGTAHLGDFDIDDIDLVAPATNSESKLPVTFSWSHQAKVAGAYSILMYSVEGDEWFHSPPVAGAMSYKLEQLPAGFSHKTEYQWYAVYNTDQATCFSWDDFAVTFKK